MSSFSGNRNWRLIPALAVTQIIGWGTTFNLPGVLARPMAQELGVSKSAVFAGITVFLVVTALVSPFLGRPYQRSGARPVLMAGSALAGVGLVMLSLAPGLSAIYAAWAFLGVAGAMMLTTAAHTAIAQAYGAGARRGMMVLMLASGLASSVFFPISSALESVLGWRETVALYGAVHLLICLPLHWLAVPRRTAADAEAADATRHVTARSSEKRLFWLLSAAISLNGFVTWGLAVASIELLRAAKLTEAEAVGLASMIGVAQVAARVIDLLASGRSTAMTSALVASAVLPASFLALTLGDGLFWASVFIVAYGVGSGVLGVSRATLPLELFAPERYGAHAAKLALPMTLAFAAAPPMVGWTLERYGVDGAAILAISASLLSLLSMVLLAREARSVEKARATLAAGDAAGA